MDKTAHVCCFDRFFGGVSKWLLYINSFGGFRGETLSNKNDGSNGYSISHARSSAGCLDIADHTRSCPNCVYKYNKMHATRSQSYCCALTETLDNNALVMPSVALPGLIRTAHARFWAHALLRQICEESMLRGGVAFVFFFLIF